MNISPKNDDLRATWFGKTSPDWRLGRAKNAFSVVSKKVGDRSNEYDLLSLTLKGIIPRDRDSGKGKFPESFDTYQEVRKGDIVFCLFDIDETPRTVGLSKLDGMVAGAYTVVRCSKLADPRFVSYFYISIDERKGLRPFYTGLRKVVRTDTFLNAPFPLPDLETQRQIADFLDRETARIDLLIEKKQRFIKALAQKWAATVTFTLTNGLFPDAPKKDAGVSWIGKVPEHWSVAKLGHIGRCANGINIGGDAFGSGFPFVSYGDAYKNSELPRSVNGLVQSSAEDRARYDLKEGDVLFTRTSETIEEIGFSSVCMEDMPNAVFAGFLIRFRPRKGTLHPLFSKFLFRNERLRAFFSKEMMIVTRASLSQGLLQRMPVVLPPIEEQHDIGQHLQKLEDTFLSVADKTQESIERLTEYRSALITAAVTGQIDMGHNNDPGSIEQEIAAADDKDEIIVPFEDPSVQVLEAEMNRADLRDAPRKAGQFYIKLMVQRFNGLKIEIFANEHPPPHFRVKTSDGTANFRIDNCEPLNGDRAILRRQREIVRWHQDNKEALIATWDRTRPSDCPVGKFRKGDAL